MRSTQPSSVGSPLSELDDPVIKEALSQYILPPADRERNSQLLDLSSFETFDEVRQFIVVSTLNPPQDERVPAIFLEALILDSLRVSDRVTIGEVANIVISLLESKNRKLNDLASSVIQEIGIPNLVPYLGPLLEIESGRAAVKECLYAMGDDEVENFVASLCKRETAGAFLDAVKLGEESLLLKLVPFIPEGALSYFVGLAAKEPKYAVVMEKIVSADMAYHGPDRLAHWINLFIRVIGILAKDAQESGKDAEECRRQLKRLNRMMANRDLSQTEWILNDSPSVDSEHYVDDQSSEILTSRDLDYEIFATSLESMRQEAFPGKLGLAMGFFDDKNLKKVN